MKPGGDFPLFVQYNFYMKKLFFCAACFLMGAVFAEVAMSDFEIQVMDQVTEFRWQLTAEKDFLKAAELCDQFREKMNAPEVSEKLSSDILLSVNNILVWEKYNALYEIDQKDKAIEKLIVDQYEIVKAYFKANKKQTLNKWLYVTAGDILCSSLQYLSLGKAMDEGLTVKKYYDDALEQDPDFVFCLINVAQWYFHAPAVSGGGKGKAMKAFKKAEDCAVSEGEKFFAKLYLSQACYEEGNKARAASLLDESEELLPGSRVVEFYRLLNENGFYYFEYPEHRKKIDSKLAKKGL